MPKADPLASTLTEDMLLLLPPAQKHLLLCPLDDLTEGGLYQRLYDDIKFNRLDDAKLILAGALFKPEWFIERPVMERPESNGIMQDSSDFTLPFLMCAVGSENTHMVQALLDAASTSSDAKKIITHMLLEQQRNTGYDPGNFPLHLAVLSGSLAMVNCLLNASPNPETMNAMLEACNRNGDNALLSSFYQPDIEVVRLLLGKGAQITPAQGMSIFANYSKDDVLENMTILLESNGLKTEPIEELFQTINKLKALPNLSGNHRAAIELLEAYALKCAGYDLCDMPLAAAAAAAAAFPQAAQAPQQAAALESVEDDDDFGLSTMFGLAGQ
jgi:hypothetical protein